MLCRHVCYVFVNRTHIQTDRRKDGQKDRHAQYSHLAKLSRFLATDRQTGQTLRQANRQTDYLSRIICMCARTHANTVFLSLFAKIWYMCHMYIYVYIRVTVTVTVMVTVIVTVMVYLFYQQRDKCKTSRNALTKAPIVYTSGAAAVKNITYASTQIHTYIDRIR